MKKPLVASLIAMLCAPYFATAQAELSNTTKPKNIIYMIGDGMGVAQTTGYRYLMDNPSTKSVETTIFDQLLVGTASTYPDDHTYVTDSAASATALSSGHKSYNGAIGVDTNKEPVLTLLEYARQLGKTTGIVSTSQVNHATPASFVAHNESRRNYDAIADAYFDDTYQGKPKVDLMLGGGTDYFIRKDRNIVEQFKAIGFQYSDNLADIDKLTTLPAMGLFAPVGLPFAIDNDELPNRLTAMTNAALRLLKNDNNANGFFIMIEGSQVDWCAHANDIACSMAEMHDFAKSIELVKAFIDSNPDTLLVVTADHSTGGLTLASDGQYLWKTEKIKQIRSSYHEITKQMTQLTASADNQAISDVWQQHVDFAIPEQHFDSIRAALKTDGKDREKTIAKALNTILNQETLTGWTTSGHTADDVQVFAYGASATKFVGFQDNTDIAKKLFQLFKPE